MNEDILRFNTLKSFVDFIHFAYNGLRLSLGSTSKQSDGHLFNLGEKVTFFFF
jgi:hypothetical protein